MNMQHKPELRRAQIHWFPVWLLLVSLFLAAGWTRAEMGVQAWMQRYGQVGDSYDEASKLVTDGAGNVIVAGTTDEGITSRDLLVIKYSGAGVPLWTNRYNGSANLDDRATAVAVDASGNVFVTGYTVTGYTEGYYPDSVGDYVTIAYSGAGTPAQMEHE